MHRMENINKYIPYNGDKKLHPNQYYHNLLPDLKYLMAHKEELNLDGDPMADIVVFMSRVIQALDHHGCLHSGNDASALKNCSECMEYIYGELIHTSDTLCEYVIDCRDQKKDTFSQNQWSGHVRDMEFTPDPEEEMPYLCKHPLENNQFSSQSLRRRDRVSTPSPSEQSIESSSCSINMSHAPVTPKKRKRKKKSQSPPSTGRRSHQNPPSLIFTKIRDQTLFDPDRSHFEKSWNHLCVDAFGSLENTPRKMLFPNINTIENRRSAITISFHERPKQSTLRFFIQRLYKNSWQRIDVFNPNHKHDALPWTQQRQNIHQSPWNNFSPVSHNRRPPTPRFSPPSSPFKPQQSPINEFHGRRHSPYKFAMPQHSTQRRLANLETKLGEILQILSSVWT